VRVSASVIAPTGTGATGPATRPTTSRLAQVGMFYEREAGPLRRIVSSRVVADEHTIEDACAYAWARLVGNADVTLDRRGLAWLALVASREGWRLTFLSRREAPLASVASTSGGEAQACSAEPWRAGVEDDALARNEHRERVRIFRTLKHRERRELFLQALGYRYEEIATMTGSTYTAVNRRLAEGRAQLRERTHTSRAAVAVAA
jgi:DNA-directed RNA polymerase specialized sigma24 family protein